MPRSYVLVGPRRLELREYQDPPLGPRDVHLRSVMSGISHGTEMEIYRGTAPYNRHFDVLHRLFVPNEEDGFREVHLGYEMVSRVVELGNQVSSVSVGQLVRTATPHQPTTIINMDRYPMLIKSFDNQLLRFLPEHMFLPP